MSSMSARSPRVSVIVPTFDDGEALTTCLASLAAQSLPPDDVEVIVVDNGSTSPARLCAAAFPRVVWLEESAPGSYAARNRGISVARGRVLAFTDADCLPSSDWLAQGLHALARQRHADVVGGRIDLLLADRERATAAELYELAFAFRQEWYVEHDGFAATANMFTTRATMDAVGPFDAALRSGGDRAWCERARARGFRVAYAPGAVVQHPARRDLQALLHKARRLAGGFFDRAAERDRPWLARAKLAAYLCAPSPALLRVAARSENLRSLRERAVAVSVAHVVRLTQAAELARRALGRPARR